MLKQRDLGPSTTWRGGMAEPDTSSPPTCANYNPRKSDLVITGDAVSHYAYLPAGGGLEYKSEAMVMRTAKMVRLNWQRTVMQPATLPCLRTIYAKAVPVGTHFVSMTRLSVPKIATYTAAYRLVLDVAGQTSKVFVMSDVLLVGRGRTEITLTTTSLYAARVTVEQTELHLARLLATRLPT